MSNRMKLSALLVAAACVTGLMSLRSPAAAASDGKQRFFEMRTYHTPDGKLEALHDRFRQHTNRLFRKHGIEMVGYWTPADAPASKNTLVFILAYPSREEHQKRWNAFANDPEWQKAKAESERDGPLVTKVDQLFMNPTDYSPAK